MPDLRARPATTVYTAGEPTLIVVPTYNEKSNIIELVQQFFMFVANVHLLIVDDNSSDGTASVVESLTTQYPSVRILRRVEERDLDRAYTAVIPYGLQNGLQI